jgi:predicted cupin superfamily sugar epimerase
MECVVSFKLTADPPPGPADNLPPGAKAGDTVQQINIDTIWWDAHGKVTRELVYGRLVWPGFSIDEFDTRSERPVLAKL